MSVVVVGLGHELRGDDAVGIAVAREVGARRPDLAVRITRGEGLEAIDLLEGFDKAILIDALHSNHDPGSVFRFDASAGDVPWQMFGRSTHTMGLGEVLALARSLGRLPPEVVLYGIEGARYGMGEPLSAAVSGAVSRAAANVIEELQRPPPVATQSGSQD